MKFWTKAAPLFAFFNARDGIGEITPNIILQAFNYDVAIPGD
jgi:hypothetical protein